MKEVGEKRHQKNYARELGFAPQSRGIIPIARGILNSTAARRNKDRPSRVRSPSSLVLATGVKAPSGGIRARETLESHKERTKAMCDDKRLVSRRVSFRACTQSREWGRRSRSESWLRRRGGPAREDKYWHYGTSPGATARMYGTRHGAHNSLRRIARRVCNMQRIVLGLRAETPPTILDKRIPCVRARPPPPPVASYNAFTPAQKGYRVYSRLRCASRDTPIEEFIVKASQLVASSFFSLLPRRIIRCCN